MTGGRVWTEEKETLTMPDSAVAPTPTIHLEGNEVVYPCRCGSTHRGPYGFYDWGHHNCFHDAPLVAVDDEQVVCPLCGQSFTVERAEGTSCD